MRIEVNDFFERLKQSTAGREIVKQHVADAAAKRQALITENAQAKTASMAKVSAIRSKIPAAAAACARAWDALREAERQHARLEIEALEAGAAADGVERRNRTLLIETAPECIDAFIAEIEARSAALRREGPKTLEGVGFSQRVLGTPSHVHSDYESRGDLIRECLAVYHAAQALKLTVATEDEALEEVKRLRARISCEPEMRQIVPRPERVA